MAAMVETPRQSISRFQIIPAATMSFRRWAATEESPAPVEEVERAELAERGVLAGWGAFAPVTRAGQAIAVKGGPAGLAGQGGPGGWGGRGGPGGGGAK